MMADISVAVRAKRKRGRPRKDSNLCNAATLPSPENSNFLRADQLLYPTPAAAATDATKNGPDSEKSEEGMVGSMVYGVVEGSFDAGYLISVRIGNNLTPFSGVVFQPRKVVAVTAANDVAPQAKMYQRREIPVPVYEDQRAPPKQAVVRPLLPPYAAANPDEMRTAQIVPKQFPYVHPTGNLRMVEEDEVMQAFEVSTSSGGSKSNLAANGGDAITNQEQPNKPPSNLQICHNAAMAAAPSAFDQIQQDEMICRETMDQLQEINAAAAQNRPAPAEPQPLKTPQVRPTNLFQDVNFHENLFSSHHNSREQEQSPNLKLDLAFTVHKEKQMAEAQGGGGNIYAMLNGMKNPNIGFHQALVAGNPLLLPPDLMGEPLEFMMDKPKTPPSSQETNMEVQSRLIGSGERFHGGGGGGVGDDAMNSAAAASPSGSSYKLELATPQSAMNTRIADMDFVISNAMQQPAQSHSHTNN